MSADMSGDIASIEESDDVEKSAKILIESVQAKLDEGIATALRKGATSEQLQDLSDFLLELSAQADALAEAVAINT